MEGAEVEEAGNRGTGFHVGTHTDVGRRRQRNEDYLSVNETSHGLLLVVCDGMGGHVGGERASRLAVQSFVEGVTGSSGEPAEALRTGVHQANAAVYKESHEIAEYSGMGTTLVAAIVRDARATVANVGDSRAYLVSAGRLRRITTDHSVVEELVHSGRLHPDEARFHPQRNLITRALGTAPEVEPDIFVVDLEQDASLLLSTDGLHGMIGDAEIERLLTSNARTEAACDALVAAALDAGGDDNVTVALLRHEGAGATSAATDADTLPPVAGRMGGHGTVWLWLAGIIVAAAAVWVLFFARPWESAGNLAPSTPPPPIELDTTFIDVDSVPVDSGAQLTPFDQLRTESDTTRATGAARPLPPSIHPQGPVTGGRR